MTTDTIHATVSSDPADVFKVTIPGGSGDGTLLPSVDIDGEPVYFSHEDDQWHGSFTDKLLMNAGDTRQDAQDRANAAQSAAEKTAAKKLSDALAQMGSADPYDDALAYVLNDRVAYNGFDIYKALGAVLAGISPRGRGDGSKGDRDLLMQKRTGIALAFNTLGGYNHPTTIVNSSSNDPTVIGSLAWALLVKSKTQLVNGKPGAWIVFDPTHGPYYIKMTQAMSMSVLHGKITIDCRAATVRLTFGDGTYGHGAFYDAGGYSDWRDATAGQPGKMSNRWVSGNILPNIRNYSASSSYQGNTEECAVVTNVPGDAAAQPLGNPVTGIVGQCDYTCVASKGMSGDDPVANIRQRWAAQVPWTAGIKRQGQREYDPVDKTLYSYVKCHGGYAEDSVTGVRTALQPSTVRPGLDRRDPDIDPLTLAPNPNVDPLHGHWEPVGLPGQPFGIGQFLWPTWNDPNVGGAAPIQDFICVDLMLINKYGGEFGDSGEAKDLSISNWTQNYWFHHCYFSNPDRNHDGLVDSANSDLGYFTWCVFGPHYKALDWTGEITGFKIYPKTQANPTFGGALKGYALDSTSTTLYIDALGTTGSNDRQKLITAIQQSAPQVASAELGHGTGTVERVGISEYHYFDTALGSWQHFGANTYDPTTDPLGPSSGTGGTQATDILIVIRSATSPHTHVAFKPFNDTGDTTGTKPTQAKNQAQIFTIPHFPYGDTENDYVHVTDPTTKDIYPLNRRMLSHCVLMQVGFRGPEVGDDWANVLSVSCAYVDYGTFYDDEVDPGSSTIAKDMKQIHPCTPFNIAPNNGSPIGVHKGGRYRAINPILKPSNLSGAWKEAIFNQGNSPGTYQVEGALLLNGATLNGVAQTSASNGVAFSPTDQGWFDWSAEIEEATSTLLDRLLANSGAPHFWEYLGSSVPGAIEIGTTPSATDPGTSIAQRKKIYFRTDGLPITITDDPDRERIVIYIPPVSGGAATIFGMLAQRPAADAAHEHLLYVTPPTDTDGGEIYICVQDSPGVYTWHTADPPQSFPGQELSHYTLWPNNGQTDATVATNAPTDIAASAVASAWHDDAGNAITATSFDQTIIVPATGAVLVEVEAYLKGVSGVSRIGLAAGPDAAHLVSLTNPQRFRNMSSSSSAGQTQYAIPYRARLTTALLGAAVGQSCVIRPQWLASAGSAVISVGANNGPFRVRTLATK